MIIPVTRHAIQIGQPPLQPALIVNQGPGVVYLDGQSSVTPQQYSLTLAPKQSVNWQGGSLWACTAVDVDGGTGTVPASSDGVTDAVTVTAHGLVTGNPVRFFGAIPTPLVVGITYYIRFIDANRFFIATSPQNAAASVLINIATSPAFLAALTDDNATATLSVLIGGNTTVSPINDVTITAPVQIAGTVPVSGNVGITGGVTVSGNMNIATMTGGVTAQIAGDIAISGAPPIDKLTVLVSGTTVSASNTLLSGVNLTGFNSIWVVAEMTGPALPPGYASTDFSFATDTGAGTLFDSTDHASVGGTNAGATAVIGFPVHGTRGFLDQTGDNAIPRSLKYKVMGSTKLISEIQYLYSDYRGPELAGSMQPLGYGGDDEIALLSGLGLALDTVVIPHRSGLHRLQITNLSSQAGNAIFRIRDIDSGVAISSALIITSATYGSIDVVLPRRPCEVSFDLVAGQTSFTLSLLPM